jgi:6-phosphofructokinase
LWKRNRSGKRGIHIIISRRGYLGMMEAAAMDMSSRFFDGLLGMGAAMVLMHQSTEVRLN